MTYTIGKTFRFSAAHQLAHLGPDHPCARLHGHNYEVEWQVASGGLDAAGWVLDYGDLTRTVGQLLATLDHRCLGCDGLCDPQARRGHLGLTPTAENLCWWLWQRAQQQALTGEQPWGTVVLLTTAVTVRETAGTFARLDVKESRV